MVLLTAFVFILGTFFGSFLCVLADRLPRGEQVLKGRSYCEKCHKQLAPIDLVPIFSYLAFGGRCRYCHAKIPLHVFTVELVSGFVVAALFLYASSLNLGFIHFSLLVVIFLSLLGILLADLKSGIIPDEFIVAIVVMSLVLSIFVEHSLVPYLLTGVACLTLFLALYLITRGRGMGFGDVKFSFALGFFLGFPSAVIGLYFAFLTATAISLILIMRGKKKLRGDTIVFGPFLAAGTIFAYFFGDKIMKLLFG